jgi:hypothetical protein
MTSYPIDSSSTSEPFGITTSLINPKNLPAKNVRTQRTVQGDLVSPLMTTDRVVIRGQVVNSMGEGVGLRGPVITPQRYTIRQCELNMSYDFLRNPQGNLTPLLVSEADGNSIVPFYVLDNAGLGVTPQNFGQVALPPVNNTARLTFETPTDGLYDISVLPIPVAGGAVEVSILADGIAIQQSTVYAYTVSEPSQQDLNSEQGIYDCHLRGYFSAGVQLAFAVRWIKDDVSTPSGQNNVRLTSVRCRIVNLSSK